jgi:UDP-N-acetylglucosamine--N-acetylmuramyl-(pentapeptide) pyrophosphoryl-undecaprenol N-acetylglucosamine transferase
MSHTVILAGGGTGGHVYPALAMGDALRARGHTVHYFGDAQRLEGRVAEPRGYRFRAVDATAFPRSGLLGKVSFAWRLLRAVARTRTMLREERASLVLGVGGYVMAPTVLAAWTLGIPTVIHEANVHPGLANRLCARVAELVLLTYPETSRHLPTKAEQQTVGCPVNPRILEGDRAAAAARYGLDPARPTLLVVGGSLGARTINDIGVAAARHGAASGAFQVLHVTGPKYLEEVRASYGTVPPGTALVGYEDRMQDAYAASDLVVCRSGSSTLAELCALGKPSVLVPSPNVTDNHQEANARGLERAGAARVIVERGLDVGAAVESCAALLADARARASMGDAARALGRIDTAEQVASLLEARFRS